MEFAARARHSRSPAACVLALFGDRGAARPTSTSRFSLAHLRRRRARSTARVIADGPVLAANEQFFIDPLNVFLVTLTAFVGLTTALFSRPYMRIERDHGKHDAGAAAAVPQHVPAVQLHDAAGADDQQHGHPVGGDGGGDADHRAAGERSTARAASLEAAWKYFILCGVGIAQALFGTILLYFAAEKVLGAEGGRAAVDPPRRGQGPARARPSRARLRVPARRLRHQGRPGAAAQLAARRARRRPDAGLGGALGPAAQRRAVRGACAARCWPTARCTRRWPAT